MPAISANPARESGGVCAPPDSPLASFRTEAYDFRLMQDKRRLVVLLLAVAGAGVDAISILAFNVLTAAQTGNTVLLAVAIARGDAATGMSAAISVATFVGGAAAAVWLMAWISARGYRERSAMTALALEVLLIGTALALGLHFRADTPSANAHALVALAAAAMGIQSAVVLFLHSPSTTYVTGMLASFAVGITQKLLAPDHQREPTDIPAPIPNGRVWLAYLSGAIVSGLIFLQIGTWALLLPLAALIGAIILRPSP